MLLKNRDQPRRLLVQSRTPKKSFVFLLEEKMVARKIKNRKESFSARQAAVLGDWRRGGAFVHFRNFC